VVGQPKPMTRRANGPLMAPGRQLVPGDDQGLVWDHVLAWAFLVERVTRIELALSAWESVRRTDVGQAVAQRMGDTSPGRETCGMAVTSGHGLSVASLTLPGARTSIVPPLLWKRTTR
jgi:hypothetical protein